MSQRIEAIFDNGAFHPQVPVEFVNGQRVSLDVQVAALPTDELHDLRDLLDNEFVASCRMHSTAVPSLENVRHVLGAFHGSLSEMISAERDER